MLSVDINININILILLIIIFCEPRKFQDLKRHCIPQFASYSNSLFVIMTAALRAKYEQYTTGLAELNTKVEAGLKILEAKEAHWKEQERMIELMTELLSHTLDARDDTPTPVEEKRPTAEAIA